MQSAFVFDLPFPQPSPYTPLTPAPRHSPTLFVYHPLLSSTPHHTTCHQCRTCRLPWWRRFWPYFPLSLLPHYFSQIIQHVFYNRRLNRVYPQSLNAHLQVFLRCNPARSYSFCIFLSGLSYKFLCHFCFIVSIPLSRGYISIDSISKLGVILFVLITIILATHFALVIKNKIICYYS